MRFAAAVAGLALLTASAQAQSVEEFYKGKTVNLAIGFSAGGGFDLYARHLARYMGKHIPGNPIIVPQNMAGAGSLRVANFLYTAAPKDGTVFGTFTRTVGVINPLLEVGGASLDATRFTWLGSITEDVSLCITWHTTGVKTWHDFITRPITLGSDGASGVVAEALACGTDALRQRGERGRRVAQRRHALGHRPVQVDRHVVGRHQAAGRLVGPLVDLGHLVGRLRRHLLEFFEDRLARLLRQRLEHLDAIVGRHLGPDECLRISAGTDNSRWTSAAISWRACEAVASRP